MPHPVSAISAKTNSRFEVLANTAVREILARGRHAARRDFNPPGYAADRICSVGHEIHDDLTQLRSVRLDVWQVVRQSHVDVGRPRHHRSKQRDQLDDKIRQIHALNDNPAAARIGQHLTRQFRRALRRELDVRKTAADW
jgi:hypothetical protein